MNTGIITARLACDPARFFSFGHYIVEVQVHFLQVRSNFAKATVLADSQVGENMSKLYCQNDYIIIEGEAIAIESNSPSTSLVIYATDVQPARLIIEE